MGIESDHRTLARVVGPGVASTDGGPIENITGFQGVAESVDPPNNNGYERTLCWTEIGQAVQALTPFADVNAAQAAGFDTSKSFAFASPSSRLYRLLSARAVECHVTRSILIGPAALIIWDQVTPGFSAIRK